MEKKEIVAYNKMPLTIKEAIVWRPDFHFLKEGIKFHLKGASIHYLICGCLLNEAYSKKIHEHDGSGARTFFEWSEKELGFKRTHIQRIMATWNNLAPLIEKYQDVIMDIEFTKLAILAPYLAKLDDNGKEELLHSGKVLNVKDLEQSLRVISGKIPQDECYHKDTEVWYRCISCNKFLKEI